MRDFKWQHLPCAVKVGGKRLSILVVVILEKRFLFKVRRGLRSIGYHLRCYNNYRSIRIVLKVFQWTSGPPYTNTLALTVSNFKAIHSSTFITTTLFVIWELTDP